MPSQTREIQHVLIATMKRAAAALREADIEFMLGGGLAAWARGGPPTDHDPDFYLREEDAEGALAAVQTTGLRVERSPAEWLFKAYDGSTLVDLIFCPAVSEQEPNFQAVLELARALREQIDWEFVRSRSGDSPFAQAFFTLVEELGIVEPDRTAAA